MHEQVQESHYSKDDEACLASVGTSGDPDGFCSANLIPENQARLSGQARGRKKGVEDRSKRGDGFRSD